MKKILILSLVAVATLWAETKIEMIVRIENLPEEIFEIYNMDDKNGDCSIYNGKRIKSGYGACGEDGLCTAILDSNVLFGWTWLYNEGIEFYVLAGATHSWREVIEDEFNHYRLCRGIIADDSTYNSMFAKIDSVLVPASNKCEKGTLDCALVYDHSRARMLGRIVGSPIFEFHEFAIDSVKARNAAISSIAPVKYKLETIRVQNHRLTASPKLLGRRFTLFDVNGHELRRGTLQNNMQLPTYPTVIKIHGFGTQLLK